MLNVIPSNINKSHHLMDVMKSRMVKSEAINTIKPKSNTRGGIIHWNNLSQ